MKIPERFQDAIDRLMDLQAHERYLAAFIFGSVAEKTTTPDSDLDVHVIVDQDNPCPNINHPTFPGYKLDITFRSFIQEEKHNQQMITKAERKPNLLDALTLFDKTGQLTLLQHEAKKAQPRTYGPAEFQFAHFLIYHVNDKVTRYLSTDPVNALFNMYANLDEVLKVHYALHGKWWVSSKKLLIDLSTWDPVLTEIIKRFTLTDNLEKKYLLWSRIIDHVLQLIGGRQEISENNCNCSTCRADLQFLN